jgi:hypothetical protein
VIRKSSVSLFGAPPEPDESNDLRIAAYCRKLRNFLMPVHPWENLRFRNAALRIQRRFRQRQSRKGRHPPRLASVAYMQEVGGERPLSLLLLSLVSLARAATRRGSRRWRTCRRWEVSAPSLLPYA